MPLKSLFQKKFILPVVILSIISSCALYGPTYKKPDTQNPIAWDSRDNLSDSSKENLPMLAWWQRFNAPSLSQLITKALKANNNIQMAVGQVEAAQGQLEQVEFAWVPTTDFLLSYGSKNTPLADAGYNIGFVPSFSLNIFQWIRSREYAKASLAAAEAAKDAVKLTIIGQTAGGYFSYLGQSYLLELQKQLVRDSKQLLDLSQIQYEKGLISLYTLQEYEQQYDSANAQIPILENNVVASSNALRLLFNENPGRINANPLLFMKLDSQGVIPTNLPSTVLKNRPDVQQAEQQLIAANASVGVATSTFFPTISLTGTLGKASNQLGNVISSGSSYWNHQSSIAFPMLDVPAFGQIKQAKGQYYAAYYNYIETVRKTFEEVDTDLSAHERYWVSYQAQMKNDSSAKKAYSLAKMSYEKGLYSYPTLLINKINWDNAQINLAKSKLAQLNTIVQLYQDLGGGYAVNP